MESNEKSSLDDRGFYFLFEDITPSSILPAIEFILEQNFEKNNKELTLVINSPGGDVCSAFALIDTMKGSKIPIRTIGLGMIASCGLLIFISGQKGRRILTPNTSILSHQYSWGSFGKEHELFAVQKEFDLTSKRMIDHYMKCTTMKEKEIKKLLLPPHDVWLSADEAKKYNICDEIKEVY